MSDIEGKCRKSFEEWCATHEKPNFQIVPWPEGFMREDGLYDGPALRDGEYYAPQTQAAWMGWKSATQSFSAERERLEADQDIPLCRLQFPDGSVPGNTAECAIGWHREAMRFQSERNDLLAALSLWVMYFDTLDELSDPTDPISVARKEYHGKRIEASRAAIAKATGK